MGERSLRDVGSLPDLECPLRRCETSAVYMVSKLEKFLEPEPYTALQRVVTE